MFRVHVKMVCFLSSVQCVSWLGAGASGWRGEGTRESLVGDCRYFGLLWCCPSCSLLLPLPPSLSSPCPRPRGNENLHHPQQRPPRPLVSQPSSLAGVPSAQSPGPHTWPPLLERAQDECKFDSGHLGGTRLPPSIEQPLPFAGWFKWKNTNILAWTGHLLGKLGKQPQRVFASFLWKFPPSRLPGNEG